MISIGSNMLPSSDPDCRNEHETGREDERCKVHDFSRTSPRRRSARGNLWMILLNIGIGKQKDKFRDPKAKFMPALPDKRRLARHLARQSEQRQAMRSDEHKSELQSLMRSSYAVY